MRPGDGARGTAQRSAARALAASLAFVSLVLAAAAAPAAADEAIFRLEDPRGDDHGDGTLRYPLGYYDLRPGDLDIVRFEARRRRGATEFEVTFAAPVKSPEGRTIDLGGGQMQQVAREGFYGVNLDVYVDTDRRDGSGGVRTLPGRKAVVAGDSAWERAIVLTPRPFDARSSLRRILLKNLRQELAASGSSAIDADRLRENAPDELERRVYFPNRVRVIGTRIRFSVPDEFLGGPARADWGYVVFSSGADVDQRFSLPELVAGTAEEGLFILPVAPGGAVDRFGGRRDDDRGQPSIVDLLVPPGQSQERILSDYALDGSRPVVLPGIVPAEVK
jgi:hypothetical protein